MAWLGLLKQDAAWASQWGGLPPSALEDFPEGLSQVVLDSPALVSDKFARLLFLLQSPRLCISEAHSLPFAIAHTAMSPLTACMKVYVLCP